MSLARLLALATLSTFAGPALAASHGPFGLGAILGDPTGVTMRYRLGEANAIDASLGWGIHNGIHANGAYVWRFPNAFRTPEPNFEWYVGVGGDLWTWDKDKCSARWCDDDDNEGTGIGVHVPIGLSYEFHAVPIEVFGQLAPDLTLVPGTGIHIAGGAGARFYF